MRKNVRLYNYYISMLRKETEISINMRNAHRRIISTHNLSSFIKPTAPYKCKMKMPH